MLFLNRMKSFGVIIVFKRFKLKKKVSLKLSMYHCDFTRLNTEKDVVFPKGVHQANLERLDPHGRCRGFKNMHTFYPKFIMVI